MTSLLLVVEPRKIDCFWFRQMITIPRIPASSRGIIPYCSFSHSWLDTGSNVLLPFDVLQKHFSQLNIYHIAVPWEKIQNHRPSSTSHETDKELFHPFYTHQARKVLSHDSRPQIWNAYPDQLWMYAASYDNVLEICYSKLGSITAVPLFASQKKTMGYRPNQRASSTAFYRLKSINWQFYNFKITTEFGSDIQET